MISWLAIGLVALLSVGSCLLLYRRGRLSERSLYLDRGASSRVFESRRHGIRAKPDALERIGGRRGGAVELVELKSGARRRPYPSDVAQVIAATLAVRASGIDVRRARLETPDGGHAIDLDASDETLYRRIERATEAARLVARGGEPTATPSAAKCRGCGYRTRCPHAA